MFTGGDNEGPWPMPDILVNVHKGGEESIGVIREVLAVCIYDIVEPVEVR